jgi:hypothetical protein
LCTTKARSGQYNYHIRAFDTSGKFSQHVTTFQLALLAPSSVRQFDVVQSANRLEFRWLPNPEPEVVAYELREGGAWDTSIFIAEVKSSSFTLPSGFDGERRFWIKADRIARHLLGRCHLRLHRGGATAERQICW